MKSSSFQDVAVCLPIFQISGGFLFIRREWHGRRGTPTWSLLPIFDDTSWAYCETLLGDSTDVREANYWHKWVADLNPIPNFPHFESARARSRQPQNHPGHSPIHLHHAADTDDRKIPNIISLNLDVRRPTPTEARLPASRE